MNYFIDFTAAFCTACIMIGALHLICPGGAMNKPVKYALSLVFLVVIIAAAGITVKKADFNFDFTPQVSGDTSGLDTAAAEYVYARILENAGINFTKITVCTDKSDNGSIVISKVIIYSDCDCLKIISALGVVAENYEFEVINE